MNEHGCLCIYMCFLLFWGVLFCLCWFVLFYYGIFALSYFILVFLDDFLFFKETERRFVDFDRREGGKILGRI